MSEPHKPHKNEPNHEEIRVALQKAFEDRPFLADAVEEEVARQLVLEGYLENEPAPEPVAEVLRDLRGEA